MAAIISFRCCCSEYCLVRKKAALFSMAKFLSRSLEDVVYMITGISFRSGSILMCCKKVRPSIMGILRSRKIKSGFVKFSDLSFSKASAPFMACCSTIEGWSSASSSAKISRSSGSSSIKKMVVICIIMECKYTIFPPNFLSSPIFFAQCRHNNSKNSA